MFRETRQTNAMTSQLLICNRPIRRTIFRQQPHPICVQRFNDSLTRAIHIASSSSMCKQRDPSIPAIRYLSVPNIQTQLYFEILYGLQNRFTAETDLIQRSLASTLKWPHYKFTSGETHWHINPVHMPVVWISYWAEFYFFICNRLSHRHASTRSGSAICVQWFTDSCNSHYISQLPCYFMDSRTERFTT